MTIARTIDGNTVTLAVSGRLDTLTSAQLTEALASAFEAGPISLVFDLKALDYISSAGLRVLLTAQKRVNAFGTKMRVVHANDMVKEIFDITGFSGVLDIA